MTNDELQAQLVQAKLTMVRYRNALMLIQSRAKADRQGYIERLASVALRNPGAS